MRCGLQQQVGHAVRAERKEGYHHTRDIRKYTARMFLFAVISHFAYVFASADFAGWRSFIPFSSGRVLNQTSVMWSLAWGLTLGRETCLQEVVWREDGWLYLKSGGNEPQVQIEAPDLPVCRWEALPERCDFEDETMPIDFQSLRVPMG